MALMIGQKIYASLVKPGMIIEPPDGYKFCVDEVQEGYAYFRFVAPGGYQAVAVPYGGLVTLLGYFNPEN